MSLSLKRSTFRTVANKNIYFLNQKKSKSCLLDKLSLKKKKGLLEFYLASNMWTDQQFYIIENNIKPLDNQRLKDCKIRKLVKTGVLLSNNILFNGKDKIKYFLRLLTFSSFHSLNQYFLITRKQGNSLPSLVKVNFLFFKTLTSLLAFLMNFKSIYISFSDRLKSMALQ